MSKYEEDYFVSLGKYEFNDLAEDNRYYDQELSELVSNFKISEE